MDKNFRLIMLQRGESGFLFEVMSLLGNGRQGNPGGSVNLAIGT